MMPETNCVCGHGRVLHSIHAGEETLPSGRWTVRQACSVCACTRMETAEDPFNVEWPWVCDCGRRLQWSPEDTPSVIEKVKRTLKDRRMAIPDALYATLDELIADAR